MNQRRGVKWHKLLLLVVIASPLIGVGIYCASRPTARGLERAIKRELPPGSSRSEVQSFLDARRIEYSDLKVDPKGQARFLPDGRRVEDRWITGVIHKPYLPSLAEERIDIFFYFDEDELLIDWDVRSHQIAQ
jgi:hypothetical protein